VKITECGNFIFDIDCNPFTPESRRLNQYGLLKSEKPLKESHHICICAGAMARSKCGGGPERALGSIFRPPLFFEAFFWGSKRKREDSDNR
jgi:hypothetical protein